MKGRPPQTFPLCLFVALDVDDVFTQQFGTWINKLRFQGLLQGVQKRVESYGLRPTSHVVIEAVSIGIVQNICIGSQP
jgi:hypothetical protein